MIKLVNVAGEEKVLPLTMSFRRVPLDIDIPSQTLYGLDGEVRTGISSVRARQFALEGSVYNPNKQRIEQELDSLFLFLNLPPIQVYRQHFHQRFLQAYPVGAPQDWLGGGAELQLRIPMVAFDPYWYGETEVVQVEGTQSIKVDGTSPTKPLITVSEVVSDFSILNETNLDTISVVKANGTIKIDNVNYSCEVNGRERLDLVTGEWLVHGFELLPGINRIKTNRAATLTFRPRWF